LDHIKRIDGELFIDGVSLAEIAEEYGTPSYVYSESLIKQNLEEYTSSVRNEDKICYAVKSNSNLSILKLLADNGSGFDVVSGYELQRCLLAGADPKKIIFSGVGKTEKEISLALQNKIFSINIESESELERIIRISEALEIKADCFIRLNPEISSESHPYIQTALKSSKFGVDTDTAIKIAKLIKESKQVNLIGIASHIGSQISKESLVLENLDSLLNVLKILEKNDQKINFVDIGGGFGITYKDEKNLSPSKLLPKIIDKVGQNINIILEPGRSISGKAGILITKTEYIKESKNQNFIVVDAGMNDLMRPSLYEAWHKIEPVVESKVPTEDPYKIVGPICESADQFGEGLHIAVNQGDLIAIFDTGAYGFSMASNYNTRTKPAEVLASQGNKRLIRSRETFEDIISQEIEMLQ